MKNEAENFSKRFELECPSNHNTIYINDGIDLIFKIYIQYNNNIVQFHINGRKQKESIYLSSKQDVDLLLENLYNKMRFYSCINSTAN